MTNERPIKVIVLGATFLGNKRTSLFQYGVRIVLERRDLQVTT